MMLKTHFFVLSLAIILFGLAGCATVYNPATQKKELILIDSAKEVQIGRGMHESMIKKDYFLLNDPAKQLLVNKIGQRVARVSDRTDIIYHFAILDNKDLNAFALPGGYVYIYSGLFEKIDESELAAILAHEIGHVAAKHSVKKMQSALGYELLIGIALAGFTNKDPALVKQIDSVSGIVYNLLSRGYGREDELFADKLAVKYLRLAGYDPIAMVRVLELLTKDTGPQGRVFEVLSTHPRMQERIKKVKEEMGLELVKT